MGTMPGLTSAQCTELRKKHDAMTFAEIQTLIDGYRDMRDNGVELDETQLAIRDMVAIEWKHRKDGNRLGRDRGKRYVGCSLSTYQATTDAQREAVAKLRVYGEAIVENVKQGQGVVLFGPKGTGKDHLMTSLGVFAHRENIRVEWENGLEIYAECRDRMKTEGGEAEYIDAMKRAQVLYISDPLPPTGTLTEYQQQTLFRVLDDRYSNLKPTWLTINVSGRKELDERVGAATADRMIDGALCIYCNWPSNRKPQ